MRISGLWLCCRQYLIRHLYVLNAHKDGDLLKNRAAIYQREAAEMLHNISLYPGLTEEQLCRFFTRKKEATAKPLLAHMLKEGRVYCGKNGRYYANQEAQIDADKDLSRCVWVLLDFIDQVEYHTVGEFSGSYPLFCKWRTV